VSVKRTNTLISHWPTVGRVHYTVVRLVTHDVSGGLSTRYPRLKILVCV